MHDCDVIEINKIHDDAFGWKYILHAFNVDVIKDDLLVEGIHRRAINQAIHSVGLKEEDAFIANPGTTMGKHFWNHKETLLDAFFAYTLNSFEICTVMHPAEQILSEADRAWMNTLEHSRALLFEIVKIPPNASGQVVRMQRIGHTLFLIVPI